MNIRYAVATGVLAAGQCAGVASGSTADNAAAVLHIHVYNLANVPNRTFERALGETTRIFRAAGVEVAWELGERDAAEAHTCDMTAASPSATQEPDDRSFLVVRVVGALATSTSPNALGFSLPHASTGAHVTVFYSPIEDIALVVSVTAAKILGHALAHEIGHVLLRSGEHSQTGIMKAVWTDTDYARFAVKCLEFGPHEAVAMPEEVSRRSVRSSDTSNAGLFSADLMTQEARQSTASLTV